MTAAKGEPMTTWPDPKPDCPTCKGNPYWGKTLSSWERCECVKAQGDPKTPWCCFCKKHHVGGDTCMGHYP